MPTELLVINVEGPALTGVDGYARLCVRTELITRSGERYAVYPLYSERLPLYWRVQVADTALLKHRFNYCESLPALPTREAARLWLKKQTRKRKRDVSSPVQQLPACQPVTWRRRRKVE